MPRPRLVPLVVLVIGAALLSGCSPTVAVDAAEDANDPRCADVMVVLPSVIEGQERRWTDAQATAAWGDPSAVIMTCGVVPPGPTEAQCITVGGVDWIVDDSKAPTYRVVTYGRVPAVEVISDNEAVGPTDVLSALGKILQSRLTRESECVESSSRVP
ncbi:MULTISPECIES: DUF3515 family protein [unclassified Microbacterium]|uniref:DUF3515 family protein n=1 Tax=unclassified Microbacterium TaxID=2609290 RepID=UPI0038691F96